MGSRIADSEVLISVEMRRIFNRKLKTLTDSLDQGANTRSDNKTIVARIM